MLRIELRLRIGREKPAPNQPELPDIYDLSGAHIERADQTYDDLETRHRTGFQPQEDQ